MIELNIEEQKSLRSQIVILKRGQHAKYPPFAFTEQGVAMLSSVLNSDRAIDVNISIMRTFIRMRQMINVYKDLEQKVNILEKQYDQKFAIVFEALKKLIKEDAKPRKRIGFKTDKWDHRALSVINIFWYDFFLEK